MYFCGDIKKHQTHAGYTHCCSTHDQHQESPNNTITQREKRRVQWQSNKWQDHQKILLLHTQLILEQHKIHFWLIKLGERGDENIFEKEQDQKKEEILKKWKKPFFTWIWVQNRKTLIKIGSLTVMYLWDAVKDKNKKKWGHTGEGMEGKPPTGFEEKNNLKKGKKQRSTHQTVREKKKHYEATWLYSHILEGQRFLG